MGLTTVQRDCAACDYYYYLEGPIPIPFFADVTRQLLQASFDCYTGFFTQGAATQPTQYHQANKDGMLKGDVQ